MKLDRAEQIASGEPWGEKVVKHQWFHLVREMVQSGEIARVGAVPWAVYCAIKSHANLETGDAFPSVARLGDLVGVSKHTVLRSLKKLVESGLLQANREVGRGSVYSVTEKVQIDEKSGEPWAVGERKYIPLGFTGFVEELQRLARTGNLPGDKAITITLNLNMPVQIVNDPKAPVAQNFYNGSDEPES